ncbi:LuxR C-terminal-related transcriptional regulator [Streptomyces sp. NPDC002537]
MSDRLTAQDVVPEPAAPEGDGPWGGLLNLLQQQEESLATGADHMRSLMAQVSALALCGWSPQPGVPEIEVVKDPLRVAEVLDKAVLLASHRILWMSPAGTTHHTLADSLTRNRLVIDRGVVIRTIQQSATSDSAGTAHLERLAKLGVQVRTASLLPFRLIVADENLAMVSLEPADATEELLLVRQPTVVRMLSRLFEFCWDGTTDFMPPSAVEFPDAAFADGDGVGDYPFQLTEQQILVLRLWARGRKDTAIARELQVSPRTLRRIIPALLNRLGVNSRFEAGLVAARIHDLLDAPAYPASPLAGV